MPARTLDAKPGPLIDDLPAHLARIFDQAQVSTANHQKNLVALHKVHSEAALYIEAIDKGKNVKLKGERAFEDAFSHMVLRVLPVKKGTTQADRVVKFVGGYVRFINEKALEQRLLEDNKDEDDSDTTASRFTARLLSFLLKGFVAKDKSVRYRALHMVCEMVSHLGEIDEEVYTRLRAGLLDRIHDREAPVRVQAAIALSKLSGSDDPTDIPEGELSILEVLMETLAYDPSPEVRRAVLLNIPLGPATTLNHILDRTRDTDTTIRKLVYSAILEPNTNEKNAMGLTHPRALTIAQRELIVRNGLSDREPSVRAAAGTLVGTWVGAVGVPTDVKTKVTEQHMQDDVVALLKLFDLAEGTIAEDALLSVFATRVDIFENLEFGDAFWAGLTPERAFLARVFVEHCINTKDDARLEAVLPVVTALAFRIQEAYNDLLEDIQAEEEDRLLQGPPSEDDRIRKEEERIEKEFVIAEMLKLAVNLDYADEIGRRKMFQLVRDMISQDTLPESLVGRCLDVLRMLSANERDLIRVVVEVVHDLRDLDAGEDEEASKEADTETNYGETPATVKPPRVPLFAKVSADKTPEENARSDAVDLRCLSLCIGMLERVNSKFEDNTTLEGILHELILPAVKSKETALREKGFISLGLCCLIARRMALNSFQLFQSQMRSAPEVLKIRVLQIIFDILMQHEGEFLGKGGEQAALIVTFLLNILGGETSEKVQALVCMGLAKLVLAGMISDERVLKNLIMAYLSPHTIENQELRQCLTYFFPVYCYSSPVNQKQMREIFIPMFQELSTMRKDLEDDEEMISSAQVAAIFLDWTDPLKVIEAKGRGGDEIIQLDMASDIMKALFNLDMEKDDKKALCQILPKLHIPNVVDDYKLRTLKLLTMNLRLRRPLKDTTSKNAFNKFEVNLTTKFQKQLENFDEDEFRKLEELKDLFEFLDLVIPEDEDEDVGVDTAKKGRKRRSDSIFSTTTEEEPSSIASSSAPQKRGKNKVNSKKRRLSKSDDESDDDSAGRVTAPPSSVAPTRSMPKRAAASKKKPVQVIVISSDDDEDKDEDEDEDEDEETPAPRRTAPRSSTQNRTAETKMESDIDSILNTSGEIPHDSIMDDSEEEEEVVNDLVLGDDD